MLETIYYCKTCEDMVTAQSPVACEKCKQPRVVTGSFEKEDYVRVEQQPETD